MSAGVFVVWLLAVWPPPIWWRDHEPRCTAMMRHRAACPIARRSMRRADTPLLERMVIIAEDARFKTHHGIDWIELREALIARRRGVRGGRRGASTITQQLAKNLYLSPSRSVFRKLKEAVTAVRLEWALPKARIMELYLNTAEFGPGVWGAAAASEAYFGVRPDQLSAAQAAALAATLPQPRSSNPTFHPARMLARRSMILSRYYGGRKPVPRMQEDSIPAVPEIEPPIVPVILLDSLVDSLIHQP